MFSFCPVVSSRIWNAINVRHLTHKLHFHKVTNNMELSAGGSIVHCPCPPYIAYRKVSCGKIEKESSVDSYSPVDNNTRNYPRDSKPSFSHQTALQASREEFWVELFS